MDKKNFDRRKFLSRFGITVGTGFVGAGFINPVKNLTNENCTPTPILEMGPYAVMKYRKQADHDIDLTRIKGQPGIAFGQIIVVKGVVKDKNCIAIQGAVVEIWSANHYGKYHHEYDLKGQEDPNFQGWGQAITNEKGEYSFRTILPGLYGSRTRHIHFKVSRRNYHELTTQLFFSGEERNNKDFILSSFTHAEQQLITQPIVEKDGTKQVEFNISLDEIKKGSLPQKVLREYVGHYILKNLPFDMQTHLKTTMNIDVSDFNMKITHKKEQLFMTLSFYPTIEMGWFSKDEFQSWSFSNTYIRFTRNEEGKVVGLKLHFFEDHYVEAIRKK